MCGWLRDKYGVSWQIIPEGLGRMLSDPDRVKSKRVMQAMLQMKKIEIKALQQAYEGT
jgi:predicted 3-demethylubiquinone-9 3-methyltransferase (glyoxalase superfamily)